MLHTLTKVRPIWQGIISPAEIKNETAGRYRIRVNGIGDAAFSALEKLSMLVLPPMSRGRNFFLMNLSAAYGITSRQLYFARRYNLVVPAVAVGTYMKCDAVAPGVGWDV